MSMIILPSRSLRLAALAAGVLLVVASPSRAQADDFDDAPWAWALASMELGGAAEVALLAGHHVSNNGLLNLAPVALGIGAGFAAYRWELDMRPALAVHGAVWSGVDLLLIGALIDGRGERTGLRFGTTSLVLGAAGVGAGAYFGATAGARDHRAWLLAPTVGMGAGLVVGGLLAFTTTKIGDDLFMQRMTMGMAGGLAASLVAVTIINATQRDEAKAAPASGLAPRIEPGPGRVMVSVGGAF